MSEQNMMRATIKSTDKEIYNLLQSEMTRQQTHIELIASENFVPRAILEAQGSILTNKYAEGYPGKKYYGGCEFVEAIESLASERLCTLFGAEHANVQPHSGSTANQAVYFTVLKPGDTMLAMKLDQGGHLSHGHPLNFTGQLYNIAAYGVDEKTCRIDYDEVRDLAKKHRPKLIVAGASAYPRLLDFAKFREIADEVGALLMTDMAHIAGLVAGGAHPNPVPYSDFVTSTTHKTLRGPRGAFVLCRKQYAADIDRSVFPGIQGGPLLPAIAGKATCFHLANTPEFAVYAAQVVANAQALGQELVKRGLQLVTGGTDNHMLLADLRSYKVTGKKAEIALGAAGITTNKNSIPFDPEKPMITSGIRLGTAAVTTRGMQEAQMGIIAEAITRVLSAPDDAAVHAAVKTEMAALAAGFPLYQEFAEPFPS